VECAVSGTIGLGSVLIIPAGSSVTVDGTGQTVAISGQHAVQVLSVRGTLDLRRVTIADGTAAGGGGIFNRGTLTVKDCTFSGNRSSFSGGAISNSGVLTVSNTTFRGNIAAYGGAIRNSFFATVGNSTFSGNTATATGGGVNNDRTITVLNSTFFGNSGVGLRNAPGLDPTVLNLGNTILANNVGGDCRNEGHTLNVTGPNLIADDDHTSRSCSIAATMTGDPILGPLADNGGPTLTHALLPGSPAIDAANDTLCAASPVNSLDQRGQPRPADGDGDGAAVCDLGAFEHSVMFSFTGFFAPLDNPPVLNVANAGRAIPVKFSLGGYQGMNILAANSPGSTATTCDGSGGASVVEETVAAGGSSLTYDAATDQYTYVWKTQKSWARTCRQLILTLTDGTVHTANVQFK
jgi:predicted outer membrane repeat protein